MNGLITKSTTTTSLKEVVVPVPPQTEPDHDKSR